ncbi:OmpA/MotB family protein [Desulfogranum marinum]|uniref:OmpA/MotB family protein n=1 Tax=Desulfogranum marinum TaxID=453220 RepID=UPI001965FF45|nr:flagellar motor protein MotB [Desulfogranum marinum]MBM9510819.1 flagellar motor protein MotB [Desulfogranum marinum]
MEDNKVPPPSKHLPPVDETKKADSVEGISRPPVDWHKATTQPTFVVEDSFFRSRTPRPVHWSIAWADLMMTMFILFLTLFIYQLANREFLNQESVEVVAGEIISRPPLSPETTLPFHPISPQISKHRADKLKSVERVSEDEIIVDDTLAEKEIPINAIELDLSEPVPIEPVSPPLSTAPTDTVIPRELIVKESLQIEQGIIKEQTEQTTVDDNIFTEIYDLSQTTLTDEKMADFASVELVPDKTVRIIIAGDLLFASGKAELSPQSLESLRSLSVIIAQTPYMINIVGHTDSVPMHSQLFPSNWELSVARASRVARFLIEDIGVPGKQIVVSGFSYFRPVRPNTNEKNRSKNRRVEIILSKEPPPAIDRTKPAQ